jgi:hypothetical protein
MRRFKKNTGKNLYQVQKAKRVINACNQKARFCRNELGQALLDGVETDHKRKIANAENGYCWSLIEYLQDYVLRSQSIEELNEWKEKFKKFNESQWMKLKQEREDLQIVDVSIMGKHIVKKIYC